MDYINQIMNKGPTTTNHANINKRKASAPTPAISIPKNAPISSLFGSPKNLKLSEKDSQKGTRYPTAEEKPLTKSADLKPTTTTTTTTLAKSPRLELPSPTAKANAGPKKERSSSVPAIHNAEFIPFKQQAPGSDVLSQAESLPAVATVTGDTHDKLEIALQFDDHCLCLQFLSRLKTHLDSVVNEFSKKNEVSITSQAFLTKSMAYEKAFSSQLKKWLVKESKKYPMTPRYVPTMASDMMEYAQQFQTPQSQLIVLCALLYYIEANINRIRTELNLPNYSGKTD